MKRVRRNTLGIMVGIIVGAALMALAIVMVFGLGTGIAGAALLICIILLAAVAGWYIGCTHNLHRCRHIAYMKGYREGMAKKTLIVQSPLGRITITMPEKGIK